MTNVAQSPGKTRQDDLERLRDLQREIAELEARAEGHLDHGRTGEAIRLQHEAARKRQESYGVEFDLLTSRPAFPSRRSSEAVTR